MRGLCNSMYPTCFCCGDASSMSGSTYWLLGIFACMSTTTWYSTLLVLYVRPATAYRGCVPQPVPNLRCCVVDQPFVNADWGNKWVHVTNHGVQRHHPDYNHDRKTLTWSGFMTEVAVGRAGVDIKRKCQELRSAIHQVVAGTFACMEVRLHRVNVCPCAKPFTYLPLSRHNGSYSCPCPTASKCLGLTCLLMRHGSRGFWRYAIRVAMHGVSLTWPPPCCCQVNECPALEGLAHPVCVLVGDYAGVTRLTLTCRRNCAKEWLTTCLGWCSTPCYQPTRHPSSHRRSLVCCPVTTATVGTRRSTSERQVRRLWKPHGMWCMRGTT